GMPVDDTSSYTLFIPRSMAKIIKKQGVQGPLYRQFVAQSVELDSLVQSTGLADPIGDKIKSQGAGIIHRYANRILFTPTTVCPINCRYCFRKNELASESFFKSNLEQLTSYL